MKENRVKKIKILEMVDNLRNSWPGACSYFHEIEGYSGSCGRCGHAVEDHEYLLKTTECYECDKWVWITEED